MLAALKNRDYRYLWSGQAISHLGDAFHLVALPWLVLAVTHDPMQLGLVLAAAGVPRALLMLFGGAVADRVSPRTVMLVSDALRFVITSALAFAIFGGTIELWMIYALAISFGIVSGFFLPAAEATIPRLLPSSQLEGGNSLIMMADQVASFVGPALAGAVIAVASGVATADEAGLKGIGVAFTVDAVSFLASAITLLLMRPMPGLGSDKHPMRDVLDGLHYVARTPMVRVLVIIVAVANFLMMGPLFVGVPVLASERLPQGAAAFGLILAAYAFGNLFGMIAAGSMRRPSGKTFSMVATALFPAFALIFVVLGLTSSTWLAAGLMVVAGVGNGYVAILAISALQRLAPKQMVGRVMALFMLASFGLAPVSQALAGAIVKVSLTGLFVGSAIAMIVPTVIAFANRNIWEFPAEEAAVPADAAEESGAADATEIPGLAAAGADG